MKEEERLAAISAIAKGAKYGQRDARRALQRAQQMAAAKLCTPEGFAHLFPAVGKRKG